MSSLQPIATRLKQAHNESTGSAAGPGDILRRARESKQISLEQMASQLKLSVRMVQNLEANDYSQINSLLFLKGYLRNYANLVGVNADEVLAAVNANQFEVHRQHLPTVDYQVKVFTREQWMRCLTMAIGVVVIAAVLMWWRANNQPLQAIPNLPAANNTIAPQTPGNPEDDIQANTPIYEDNDVESSGPAVEDRTPTPSKKLQQVQPNESFARQLKNDHENL